MSTQYIITNDAHDLNAQLELLKKGYPVTANTFIAKLKDTQNKPIYQKQTVYWDESGLLRHTSHTLSSDEMLNHLFLQKETVQFLPIQQLKHKPHMLECIGIRKEQKLARIENRMALQQTLIQAFAAKINKTLEKNDILLDTLQNCYIFIGSPLAKHFHRNLTKPLVFVNRIPYRRIRSNGDFINTLNALLYRYGQEKPLEKIGTNYLPTLQSLSEQYPENIQHLLTTAGGKRRYVANKK